MAHKEPSASTDRVDDAILRELEADSRISAQLIASRLGLDLDQCRSRISDLERRHHIAGYTISRAYPDPARRPSTVSMRVLQDPSRSGYDLIRTLDFIPEIISAEVIADDGSLLLRLQADGAQRVADIAATLEHHSAVLAVHVAHTTVVIARPQTLRGSPPPALRT